MNKTNKNPSLIQSGSNVVFYELEKVRFIMKDGAGLDIDYAYDDLVFSEHGIFIIQFEDKASDIILCWFNKECIDADRLSLLKSLNASSILNKMKMIYKGKFEMEQKENEQIAVNFIES